MVNLDASLRGAVEHEGRILPVRIEEEAARIHAIVSTCDTSDPRVYSRSAPIEESVEVSAAARTLAIDTIAPVLGVPPEDLEIVRSGRIPLLLRRGGRACGDLSLSHHGRFVAFACEISATSRQWRTEA